MSEDFPLAGTASVGSADSHRSGNGDRAGLKGYRGAAARPQAVRGLPDACEKWVSEDFPRARGRGVARDFRFDQFTTLIGWPARKADTLATVASMRPPRLPRWPGDVRCDQAVLRSQERIVRLDWLAEASRGGPPTASRRPEGQDCQPRAALGGGWGTPEGRRLVIPRAALGSAAPSGGRKRQPRFRGPEWAASSATQGRSVLRTNAAQ